MFFLQPFADYKFVFREFTRAKQLPRKLLFTICFSFSLFLLILRKKGVQKYNLNIVFQIARKQAFTKN
ncbi:MAG: hypothetical protein COC08_01745 [Maribacter sp.]|nr:MAG: hypothetical protein COC08_01745 [Maribacter sp.]